MKGQQTNNQGIERENGDSSGGIGVSGVNQPEVQGQCLVCGAFTYPDDRFCACCGEKLGEHTGPHRHPVSFFCTECGSPVGDTDEGSKEIASAKG